MTEEQIDALVYAALTTDAGQRFHAWLVNNYLQTPTRTIDPNQALVQQAEASLVGGINSRFARHLERSEKPNAARRETEREPGAGTRKRRAKRTA